MKPSKSLKKRLQRSLDRLKTAGRKKYFWVLAAVLATGLAVGVWALFFRGKNPFNYTTLSAGDFTLTPLKDPLLPDEEKTGNYVIRYVECETDAHLNLELTDKEGQLYISDNGTSLQSASYTLNGWTDPNDCNTLSMEPIRPYRLYHLLKFSIARPTITESWMADTGTPKPEFKRSELFFYVVPQSETWNPVGESFNPIGRPAAFNKLPAFKLKNRTYGFEYDLLDETDERKKQLDITYNWIPGKKHLMVYSTPLAHYLQSLPALPNGVKRAFHDLTMQQCEDFADTLGVESIMAFDIEPGKGEEGIIDYDHANFNQNMEYVINRLKSKGAMAYNWLQAGNSPRNVTLAGTVLNPGGGYGDKNKDIDVYKNAYGRLNDVKKNPYPYSLINTGIGYDGYDTNFAPGDGNGINTGPQLTYLRALDASELWKRLFPGKEQAYFTWPFQEFNYGKFPTNHVVDIPDYNAKARRTDNKPMYPPSYLRSNLVLSLVNAKYLFYWSPGPVGWDPANIHENTSGFNVWTMEQGSTPDKGRIYLGKEAMAINEVLKSIYLFSLIQDAMDGTRTGLKFSYQRAKKDGSMMTARSVGAIGDGSWYNDSLTKKQPFALLLENMEKTFQVLLVQDVWARPGRFTDFEIELGGRKRKGRTEGNELFAAIL